MGRWATKHALAQAAKARTISADPDGTSYFADRFSVLGLPFRAFDESALLRPSGFS
jgi:hypothetical protein